jgi:SAM-dependent methyltransferase
VSKKRKISVDDAYAVETPADNVRLYADWADTYDSDFVASKGYVYHLRVAEILVRERSLINGAVLDVGCGTGTVGVSLRDLGPGVLDKLWRLAAPSALCAIGINSRHYELMGFGERLSADVVNGTITKPELIEVDIYSVQSGNLEHASDKALIVVCQIV